LRKRSSLFAWLQLLRLPNVFTALADVAMGYLVTHGELKPALHFSLLAAASCLLYLSGIVLNDVFDAKIDAQDRPERPIPSGRVSFKAASALGWATLIGGVLIGWYVACITSDWRPGLFATSLAVCIVLYDWVLKRTSFAPLAMGACRTLNVLLGMSLASLWLPQRWLIALGIGIYIVGVTIFARTEARVSPRPRLIGGSAVLIVGIALLAVTPLFTTYEPDLAVLPSGWFLLWVALALIIGRRCVTAIAKPAPQNVQAAVRNCVHSIIALDAAVCVGYASPYWAFAVLALLFPTMLFTLWLNAT
jgi:4-hydroxybenzoate polyprenyltransferase